MKIGDYVRYKKFIYHNQGVDDIRISKIKDIEDAIETGYNQKFIFLENGNGEYEDRIIKSSPDITDLLQPTDLIYVDIDNDYAGGIIVPRIAETQAELNLMIDLIKNGKWILKGVVTKEQLDSARYKVGD